MHKTKEMNDIMYFNRFTTKTRCIRRSGFLIVFKQYFKNIILKPTRLQLIAISM